MDSDYGRIRFDSGIKAEIALRGVVNSQSDYKTSAELWLENSSVTAPSDRAFTTFYI